MEAVIYGTYPAACVLVVMAALAYTMGTDSENSAEMRNLA